MYETLLAHPNKNVSESVQIQKHKNKAALKNFPLWIRNRGSEFANVRNTCL